MDKEVRFHLQSLKEFPEGKSQAAFEQAKNYHVGKQGFDGRHCRFLMNSQSNQVTTKALLNVEKVICHVQDYVFDASLL